MPRPRKSTQLNASVEAWEGSHANRSWCRQLAANPMFQQFMLVVSTLRPTGYPSPGRKVEDPSLELGRREGYDDCLRNIQMLLVAEEPQHQESLEPTYTKE